MTPAEIDAALPAWLPPSVISSIEPDFRWRKRDEHDTGHSESYIAGYDCSGDFGEREASEALKVLELLNARADIEDCLKELARLKVLTKERALSGDDIAFQIATMGDELSAYPLDVVRDACRSWADHNKFFPAWAELREPCEERVLERRCPLDALRRYFQRKAAERDQTAAGDQVESADETTVEPNGRQPYNALWRSRQPALEQAVATRQYRAWLRDLTPVVPSAGTQYYQLGTPTAFIRDYVASHYQEVLEQVLGRAVRVVVFNPSNRASRAT